MYYKQLEGFLRDKTAEYSAEMQEIIGGIVPVYNSGADAVMDASLEDAFGHISFIIDDWMKLVLQMELMENGKDSADAYLIMPFDTVEYRVEYNVSGVVSANNSNSQFNTPIGKMDYFVYRCICDIAGNPVQIFYKWVKQQCDLAHILISLSPEGYVPQEVRDRFEAGETVINWDGSEAEGFPDDILNDAILDLAGVSDPLNLCSLDTCVSHIDEFFSAYGFHEGYEGQLLMSLNDKGYKAGGHPQPLTKVRLKLNNDGDVILIGIDKYGFKRELVNPHCFKFDACYVHIVGEHSKYNYICYFAEFDWERPMIPSDRVPKLPASNSVWYAIYDLLADSSLYAFNLSGVVPYDKLIAKYGEDSYEAVDLEGVTDIVVQAIHQRDSK